MSERTALTKDLKALVRSIRSSPLASIVTDPRQPDNPIVAANKSFEVLTGYTESELLGRNCRILAGPATERVHSDTLARAVAEASPVVVELMNYRKNGAAFLNAVMIAPVFANNGELAFFVGSQMEVSGDAGLSRAQARARLDALTPKQKAVLRLTARGLRSRHIGEQMGLTEKTIKMHRSALVKRLGLTTSAEAIRLAVEAGE